MIKIYYTFFCFDDVTSGFEISTILLFSIGQFVQISFPKGWRETFEMFMDDGQKIEVVYLGFYMSLDVKTGNGAGAR